MENWMALNRDLPSFCISTAALTEAKLLSRMLTLVSRLLLVWALHSVTKIGMKVKRFLEASSTSLEAMFCINKLELELSKFSPILPPFLDSSSSFDTKLVRCGLLMGTFTLLSSFVLMAACLAVISAEPILASKFGFRLMTYNIRSGS